MPCQNRVWFLLQEKSKASAPNPPALRGPPSSSVSSAPQRADAQADSSQKIETSSPAVPVTKEAPTDLFDLLNIDSESNSAADDNGWAAFQCESWRSFFSVILLRCTPFSPQCYSHSSLLSL